MTETRFDPKKPHTLVIKKNVLPDGEMQAQATHIEQDGKVLHDLREEEPPPVEAEPTPEPAENSVETEAPSGASDLLAEAEERLL